MSERVGYEFLLPAEREAIHDWLRDHGIEPRRTPIGGLIENDPVHGEWRIEQFWLNAAGRMQLDETGDDVRRIIVRRRAKRPLPWPMEDELEWVRRGAA